MHLNNDAIGLIDERAVLINDFGLMQRFSYKFKRFTTNWASATSVIIQTLFIDYAELLLNILETKNTRYDFVS
jgi:hypothetical protein